VTFATPKQLCGCTPGAHEEDGGRAADPAEGPRHVRHAAWHVGHTITSERDARWGGREGRWGPNQKEKKTLTMMIMIEDVEGLLGEWDLDIELVCGSGCSQDHKKQQHKMSKKSKI